jgi:hypothetical protein
MDGGWGNEKGGTLTTIPLNPIFLASVEGQLIYSIQLFTVF